MDIQGDLQETNSPKGVSDVRFRTVKVSNVSLSLSERDIFEFLTFSGEILYIEMKRESEKTQVAYVTFSNSLGADSAAVLTGSTMAGLAMSITVTKEYQLPPHAVSLISQLNWEQNDTFNHSKEGKQSLTESAVKKTEEVVSTTLAKGFVFGKDALKKAMSLDEKRRFRLIAMETIDTIDRNMGFSETLSMGTIVAREVDNILQVSEMTKSALAVAEETASTVIMSNHYFSAAALLVSTMLSSVSKVAVDVSVMTKEKVDKAEEEEKRETLEKEGAVEASEFVNAR